MMKGEEWLKANNCPHFELNKEINETAKSLAWLFGSESKNTRAKEHIKWKWENWMKWKFIANISV